MYGYQLVKMGDHEFAAWLRKQDKNWTYRKMDESCTHFVCNGIVVAVVFYDNANSTHKIYIKE